MSERSHVEWVQCHRLPWQDGFAGGDERPGVESKLLSRDSANGAASLLVSYPARWAGVIDVDGGEECYVLRGALQIDGVEHPAHSYFALAAGSRHDAAAAAVGATVLCFVGSDAARTPVLGHDALRAPWQATFTVGLPPGAARKDLAVDPVTGAQTWLLGTMPMRWGTRPERHPVVEEMLLLSGRLVSPLGTMTPGAYFWRPPGIDHGPYGSLTGTLALFRTVGGPLETTYGDETGEPFDWTVDETTEQEEWM